MKTNRPQPGTPAFRLMIATAWLAPDSWHDHQEVAIRQAIAAQPDWNEYLSLVDRHRTPALSYAALTRVPGIPTPPHILEELQLRNHAARVQALQLGAELVHALKLFNHEGIPVIPLKGPMLSHELYGDIGMRHVKDIDVEAPRAHILRAQKCLTDAGWKQQSAFFPMTPRQWQSFLHHEHSLDFTHVRTEHPLELHWHSQWETPEEANERWARSTPALWQGQSIRVMLPADRTLYLCCHGSQHLWFRAKWLGDLARAHTLGILDWDATWVHARIAGHERVVLSALGLLQSLFGLPVPSFTPSLRDSPTQQLVYMPLRALQNPREPLLQVGPAKFRQRMRLTRYLRLLWPRHLRRETLSDVFYARQDFQAVPLPDSLFWLYKPLRLILWLGRWMRRMFRRRPKSKPAD